MVFLQVLHHSFIQIIQIVSHDTEKGWKLNCGFKYDLKNLVKFHTATQKSEIFTSMGSFWRKYIKFELKKIQRSYLSWHWTVMQNLNKPDLVVSKIAWGIGLTSIRALKSLKNCTLKGSSYAKHTMFQLGYFIRIICHDTEGWCKIKEKLTCGWKNDIRNLINFHVSSQSLKICTLIGCFCLMHIKI